MKEFEEKLIGQLAKKKYLVFLGLLFVIGLYIRFVNKYFESEDYLIFLSKWYLEIKNGGGLSALSHQVGNYPVSYQALIAIFTYLPISPLYAYKGLSVIFDFLLCIETARLVWLLSKDRFKAYLAAAIVWMSPLVIMNSATWGQCDSIFTFFLVLTVRKLYEKKYIEMFIYYGIAFAFKMQAIFLLPFLFYVYFAEREFPIVYFLISFASMYATNIPAFFFGRSILEPFRVYSYLADFSSTLCMNAPNLWAVCGGDYDSLYYIALGITLLILGSALLYLFDEKKTDLKDVYLELAIWTLWACVLFLPAMHERYFYPAEILLIVIILVRKRFLAETIILYLASLQGYCWYLFYYPMEDRSFVAAAVIFAWVHISVVLFRQIAEKRRAE